MTGESMMPTPTECRFCSGRLEVVGRVGAVILLECRHCGRPDRWRESH